MRGVRSVVAGLAICILAAGACLAAAATIAPPKLKVSPASGVARSSFTVHFTAPAASGTSGTEARSYSLSGTASKHRAGCIDTVSMTPQAASANEPISVKLNPARLGGHWCRTTYSGEVTETIRPLCGPVAAGPRERGRSATAVCPEYIAIEPLGSFRFTVKR